MKVLYANPIFLDYRLPFYKRLNELFDGQFYILYSPARYKSRYDKLLDKIPEVMGKNAIPFNGELLYNTYEKSFKRYNIEKGKRIPITHGLIRTIWKVNPDVLITEGFYQWTPLVILYSILRHKPVFIGYERTCYTERNTGIIKKIHRKITNLFVTGYLVNGSETKKYLKTLGVKESKIHIGGMSADSEGLRHSIRTFSEKDKSDFKQQYKRNTKGLIYLFTGMIIKRKGVDYLLKAWTEHIKKYPDDCLILVGGGTLLDNLRSKYTAYKSIYFEGRVEYDIIYKFYAIADVYILPTIEDNWSLVIPEAMACGLPVATSIYNGCHPELIKEGVNGYVFDTYKIETIVSALDKFHHANLYEMGRKSIELEKPFNTENCAKREYKAIITTLNQ